MGLFIYPVFIGSSRGSLSRGGGFLELFVDPLDLAELELTQTKQTVRVVAVQAAWALRGISLGALYVPADHKHYRHMSLQTHVGWLARCSANGRKRCFLGRPCFFLGARHYYYYYYYARLHCVLRTACMPSLRAVIFCLLCMRLRFVLRTCSAFAPLAFFLCGILTP